VGVDDPGVGEAGRHEGDAAGVGRVGLGRQHRHLVADGDRDVVGVDVGPVADGERERVGPVVERLERRFRGGRGRQRDRRTGVAAEGPRVGQVLAVRVRRAGPVERDDAALVDGLVRAGVRGRAARRLVDDAAPELEHVVVVVAVAPAEEVLEADLGLALLEEVHDGVRDAVRVAAAGAHQERVAGVQDLDPEDELDAGRERPDLDDEADVAVRREPLRGTGLEQPQLAREAGRRRQDLDLDGLAAREELAAELRRGGGRRRRCLRARWHAEGRLRRRAEAGDQREDEREDEWPKRPRHAATHRTPSPETTVPLGRPHRRPRRV
jgi:hypothetical protein